MKRKGGGERHTQLELTNPIGREGNVERMLTAVNQQMALKYPNACCSAPTVTLFATDHLCSMVLNSLRGCEIRVKKRTKRGEEKGERREKKKEKKKNEMLYTVAETVF